LAALDSLPELEVLYLVTTPDLMSLDRAKRAIRNVEERGFTSTRLKVLLNRAGERGKTDTGEIEGFLGRACEAVFRNDHMSLYDAYSEGRFLPPTSPLGKELQGLANSILAHAAGECDRGGKTAPPAPEVGKRWFSFLQKAPGLEKNQGQGAQA
jgi:Flp pilus assembly CpaE family ATPase